MDDLPGKGQTARLIMFSGGLDSTYQLYKVLQDHPDDVVFILHVTLMKDSENYHKLEYKAVHDVISWLRDNHVGNINDRIFNPKLDLRGHPFGYDPDGIIFLAQKVVYNLIRKYDFDRIVNYIGLVGDDGDYAQNRLNHIGVHGVQGVNNNIWRSLLDSMIGRVNQNKLDRVDRDLCFSLWYPEKIFKRDIVRDIPRELLDMVWYCRHPQGNSFKPLACGECGTCRQTKRAYKDNGIEWKQ